MTNLNERQAAELAFWERVYEKHKDGDYARVRASNLYRIRDAFPEIDELTGVGLDVGCGHVSIFESSGLNMYAVDPLMEAYQKIYIPEEPTVIYARGHQDDGILNFPNGNFDYLFCINVIDHTPAYRKLLEEMRRVLKPQNGLLFLQVNFDNDLEAPAHTKLWNINEIYREVISWGRFKLLRGTTFWNDAEKRYEYWGVFSTVGPPTAEE